MENGWWTYIFVFLIQLQIRPQSNLAVWQSRLYFQIHYINSSTLNTQYWYNSMRKVEIDATVKINEQQQISVNFECNSIKECINTFRKHIESHFNEGSIRMEEQQYYDPSFNLIHSQEEEKSKFIIREDRQERQEDRQLIDLSDNNIQAHIIEAMVDSVLQPEDEHNGVVISREDSTAIVEYLSQIMREQSLQISAASVYLSSFYNRVLEQARQLESQSDKTHESR